VSTCNGRQSKISGTLLILSTVFYCELNFFLNGGKMTYTNRIPYGVSPADLMDVSNPYTPRTLGASGIYDRPQFQNPTTPGPNVVGGNRQRMGTNAADSNPYTYTMSDNETPHMLTNEGKRVDTGGGGAYRNVIAPPVTVQAEAMGVNYNKTPTGGTYDPITKQSYPTHQAFLDAIGNSNEFSTGGSAYKQRFASAQRMAGGNIPKARQMMSGYPVYNRSLEAQGSGTTPTPSLDLGQTGQPVTDPQRDQALDFYLQHGSIDEQMAAQQNAVRRLRGGAMAPSGAPVK
jgi:hypothetical protein